MKRQPEIAAPGKRQRDLRLDFFRGLAMFIILIAHTPNSLWRMWIPARFGFSDATEIFVFCSGMASGIAFGAVFLKKSWFLGAARIVFRIWQVYWAHIGVVIGTAAIMVALQSTGMGEVGKDYTQWFPIGGFFSTTEGRPEATLLGLFTMTYIPGLFDILPMYLVVLAMIPLVMGLYRLGGRNAVFAFVAVTWTCANLGNFARVMADVPDPTMLQAMLISMGQPFLWMNLPGIPWEPNAVWFFNPFGWQLVFFTGFAFAMGWIPAPPVRRELVIAAIVVLVVTLPFAWYKLYQYETGYVPDSMIGRFFWDGREALHAFRWKGPVGAWRYLHFLSIAYLAWAAVGPGGIRLTTGWEVIQRTAETRFLIRALTGGVLLLTAPYIYIEEIKALAPALDRWFFATIPLVPGRYIGMLHLVHMAALIAFAWHAIGDAWRHWLVKDAFLRFVLIVRKVGTQSLAVFLVSLAFSRIMGWSADSISAWIAAGDFSYLAPRDVWVRTLINLLGFAVLIGTAYGASWFKRQPWRDRTPGSKPASTNKTGAASNAVPAE
ncbi:MAG: OpgC domain-containing protein [Pseudomonadota bacterium]